VLVYDIAVVLRRTKILYLSNGNALPYGTTTGRSSELRYGRDGHDGVLSVVISCKSSELIIEDARFFRTGSRSRSGPGRRFKMHRRSLNAEPEARRSKAAHMRMWTDDAASISASTFYGRFGNAAAASRLTLVPLSDRNYCVTEW